jgi:hypothetical protein
MVLCIRGMQSVAGEGIQFDPCLASSRRHVTQLGGRSCMIFLLSLASP